MKIATKAAIYWTTLAVVAALAFSGGWLTRNDTARTVTVTVDPSGACLASSQYASLVLARERRARLISRNEEDKSAEKVRELSQENDKKLQKATVLQRSFEDQCQKDLQDEEGDEK